LRMSRSVTYCSQNPKTPLTEKYCEGNRLLETFFMNLNFKTISTFKNMMKSTQKSTNIQKKATTPSSQLS